MTPDPQICTLLGLTPGMPQGLPQGTTQGFSTGHLAALAANPPLPAIALVPIALFAMIFIAGHIIAMNEPNSGVPRSRKRIRSANGVMLMWLVALVTYAVSILNPEDTSKFVLTWLAIISVVGLVMILAMLDVLNTVRLHATARKILRDELKLGISSALCEHTSHKSATPKLASHHSTGWGRSK